MSPGAVCVQQVHIKVDSFFPWLAFELGLPVHVKPLSAKCVDHGRYQRHVVTPAWFASQANAVDTIGRVMDSCGELRHFSPCWVASNRDTGFVSQIFSVHEHRALAVKGHGVHFSVD